MFLGDLLLTPVRSHSGPPCCRRDSPQTPSDPRLASAERAAHNRVGRALADDTLNLAALIPEHFGRYFAFFTPGHTQGIVPSRIKELARLKIAALNQCDT